MELRHLRYFVAVAEEENVTRAAARLHVSQPPLTRQIRDLEEEMGVALFERRGKVIRLTDLGRSFLEEAKASLKRVEDGVERIRAAARGQAVDLHLGYAPSPAVEILPEILRAMEKRAPGVRVLLHDHTTPEMLAGLREGRLQAALMMQPPRQAARGLNFLPMREYPMGILVHRTHRFANRSKVELEEVLEEAVVAFARREYPDYHALLRRVLGRRSRLLRVVLECDGGPSLMAAVGSGKGLAIGPSVFTLGVNRQLRFVAITAPAPPAIVGLAYRREATLKPLRTLVEVAGRAGRVTK
jgi:DNA-binding transcriptional LysR family regulator